MSTTLPEVPAGTRLRLLPGEWSPYLTQWPGHELVVQVERLLPHAQDDRVWLSGHMVECSWESSDCSLPCLEIVAMVAGIRRALREAEAGS